MEDKLSGILERLLNHEISKAEAAKELKCAIAVWGGGLERGRMEALNASVSTLYFGDRSGYKNAHFGVVRSITGIESFDDGDIAKMYRELNPE